MVDRVSSATQIQAAPVGNDVPSAFFAKPTASENASF
ncbi:hypothetical protein OROHE_003723 [Orobanche hederae]